MMSLMHSIALAFVIFIKWWMGTASGPFALYRYVLEPSVDFAKWNVGYSKNVQYMILFLNRKLCETKISHFHSVLMGCGEFGDKIQYVGTYISDEKRGFFTIRIPWLARLAGRRRSAVASSGMQNDEMVTEQNDLGAVFIFPRGMNVRYGAVVRERPPRRKAYKFLIQWIQ